MYRIFLFLASAPNTTLTPVRFGHAAAAGYISVLGPTPRCGAQLLGTKPTQLAETPEPTCSGKSPPPAAEKLKPPNEWRAPLPSPFGGLLNAMRPVKKRALRIESSFRSWRRPLSKTFARIEPTPFRWPFYDIRDVRACNIYRKPKRIFPY